MRILLSLSSMIVCAGLSACGGGDPPTDNPVSNPPSIEDESDIAEILEIIETLDTLYTKNCPQCRIQIPPEDQ